MEQGPSRRASAAPAGGNARGLACIDGCPLAESPGGIVVGVTGLEPCSSQILHSQGVVVGRQPRRVDTTRGLYRLLGPNERDYKRGANLKFEKGVGAKYLELKITDRQRRAQPEFAIKDWE
jgi:hypothetical protein